MLGFNGGLEGVRRVPSIGGASGLWFPNEQSVAQRALIWPSAGDPTPGLSPVLWYDFADESQVTLSGSAIVSITDKGSRGWTLTSSSTKPTYVTGMNGKKCLDWGTSPSHANYMRNTDSTSTTIGEVYVVVDANFGGNIGGSGYAGLFTSTSSWFVLGSGGSLIESGTGFNSLYINNGVTNRVSSLFSTPSIDNPAILRINNSSGTPFSTASGFEIGNDRANFGLQRGWCGLIGEYIVFSSVLGSVERNLLMQWLAVKWGITLV